MCFYLRMLWVLSHNLCIRIGNDVADWFILRRRRLRYWFCLTWCKDRYDDVGGSEIIKCCELDETDGSELIAEIQNKVWFKNFDRKKAQEFVHEGGEGCFIVRPSSLHPLTLTLWYGNKAYNIPLRKREDGLIALGTKKPNEQAFNTIEEMVKYHMHVDLILFSGGEQSGRCRLLNAEFIKLENLKHTEINIPEYLIC